MQQNLAKISLKKLVQNAAQISRCAGEKPLFAVIKDDAYGHGAPQIAHALEGKVHAFAVATVDEGMQLRCAGITSDILVFTPPTTELEVLQGVGYGLILTLSCLSCLRLVKKTAEQYSLAPRVHLAVNTGMNRMGFRPERVKCACREGRDTPILFEGIYSHYYAPEKSWTRREQNALFQRACEGAGKYFPNLMRHISATGGILAGERECDAVRSGIALYGYFPRGFAGALPVKPIMKVYTHVVQSGTFFGHGIGYSVAKKGYGKLKTLRLGYGDGVFRQGYVPAVGNLCMDACVSEGASRFGRRVLALSDFEQYAQKTGTIAYEVLLRIGAKAVKLYER